MKIRLTERLRKSYAEAPSPVHRVNRDWRFYRYRR